jgi:hypothetical protein
MTYHGIMLKRGGTAFDHDHMTRIVLKANGKPIQEFSGSDLDDFNVFDGLAEAANDLSYINFERAGLLNKEWVEATGIGTSPILQANPALPNYNPNPITSLTLDVHISGSTAPTLSAKAEQSAPKPTGAIIKRRKFTYAAAGAGTLEISDLPRGDLINRILIHAAGDYLTDVTLSRDNFEVFNRSAAENDLLQSNGVKVPVAKWFIIDPTEKGDGNEAIITAGVSDFRLGCTVSQAETLTVYVEYLGGLQGN